MPAHCQFHDLVALPRDRLRLHHLLRADFHFASDVPIGTANFNPAAPAVDYRAQDLGLSPGNAVCFQIFAYDTAHAIYNWSEVQCTLAL
jgi:hypothetical protein